MQTRLKVALSWSGGKDSALALHELRQSSDYEVVSLLTSVAKEFDRVSHHGVRTELLERQAEAIGIPLRKLLVTTRPTQDCGPDQDDAVMRAYEELMRQAMLDYKEQGIEDVAFGDIFLRPLRDYREQKLALVGMRGVFPIWQRDTAELVRSFIDLGFKARLSCVDGEKLGREFAGRALDGALLSDLPSDVDPCGENGEYHTFVYDGPIFRHPVPITVGEVVKRDVRYFADLLPV